MTGNDVPESETPVFTEAEVFVICGWLAAQWDPGGDEKEHLADIEEAIQIALTWEDSS
jgi:hypothetical protein